MRRRVFTAAAAACALLGARAFGADRKNEQAIHSIPHELGYDPYVPTPPHIVDAMLDLAAVGPDDVVMDLGSGDGRIVIAAARRGARGVGVELDRSLVDEARANARKAGVEGRVRFLAYDLFEADLAQASVLMLYLLPESNRKLLPRILAQMRPGSRVVGHRFLLGDWRPDAVRILDPGEDYTAYSRERPIYLWRVPFQVAGEWEVLRDGYPRGFRLTLFQSYQFIGGAADVGEAAVPLERARLDGNVVRFTVAGLAPVTGDYVGTIEGTGLSATLEGTVGKDGVAWKARRIR